LKYETNFHNKNYFKGDVFLNLHGEVGKTQCVKILASLASSKELVEKEYGKQKIYFAFQVCIIYK
jgi:hypothetical protein